MKAALTLVSTAVVTAIPITAAERFKSFKLKTPEGDQRTLADMLGKVTLVEFFYPSCPYCNQAFPEVQRIANDYKDRGLSTVWINVLPEEDKLVKDWRAKHNYTVPILLGGHGAQTDYKIVMTPTHYLLDAQGAVLSRHAGYKPGDEKALERDIQNALTTP